MTIYSCVDVLPIPQDDNQRKLFVDCEMKVGENIEANIQYEGNSRGLSPQYIERPDTFTFTLAEGDTDFGVPFVYDYDNKIFVIKKNQLPLKAGVKYKFRGVGINKNSTEPFIFIPTGAPIDTVFAEKINTPTIDGKSYTMIRCTLRMKTDVENSDHLYIIAKTEDNKVGLPYFEQDFAAYKKMKHRDGFLVDQSRLKTSDLIFNIALEGAQSPKAFLLDIGNVTKSFYQFNLFKSNSFTDPGQTAENPAIGSFNIDTEIARGSFSAFNTSSIKILIK